MISGISAVSTGLRVAAVRFERAAEASTRAWSAPESVPAETDDGLSGITNMMSAKLQFSASLVALRTANEMAAEVIRLGGYGTSGEDAL
jgi:hypothetical protein